jgi:microcystin-dependent protein
MAFVGQIIMFGGNFAPVGWAACAGQLMAIDQNDALFNLIGTTYGGDGVRDYRLPDLRGRVPIHFGGTYAIGQAAGSASVPLTMAQIPSHTHVLNASSKLADAAEPTASDSMLATVVTEPSTVGVDIYAPPGATQALRQGSISSSSSGGPLAHENQQPFQAVTYLIAMVGTFPIQQ